MASAMRASAITAPIAARTAQPCPYASPSGPLYGARQIQTPPQPTWAALGPFGYPPPSSIAAIAGASDTGSAASGEKPSNLLR